MSLPLDINGTSYNYPETGDTNWGSQATLWASAVTVGMLQRAGGAFTLTAEVDFGATYGLLAPYYKSKGTNIATAGAVRLARTEVVSFRNQANAANLDLGVSASDVLQFNGEDIISGAIVNADISASAAIVFSKMAALTASRAVVTDGSGVIGVSAATSTEVGYISGVTSALQTQIDAKAPIAGPTFTGAVTLAQDPVSAFQAATKQYVDALVTGLQPKASCRLATTANITTATDLENGDTLDGVVIATGDRILVKDQSSPAQNGIYVAPASGAASRSTDMDTWTETIQAYAFVEEGTANAGTGWVSQTAAGGTLGVTAVPFVQFSSTTTYSADGQGIELSGTTFSLELDGATLSKSASGIKVNEIANANIAAAAAIAVNKLAALTASRAVVSDGSGFLAAATTTSTEIGYVNGVTSAIQTQLDAKIAASVMTTNNDMIYRAAGVPARLASGTDTYILKSVSGVPTWSDQKKSWGRYTRTAPALGINTTWTKFSLPGSPTPLTTGTAVTVTSGSFTVPWDGVWQVEIYLGKVAAASARAVFATLYNAGQIISYPVSDVTTTNGTGMYFKLSATLTNAAGDYEIQLAASGSGVTADSYTVDSRTSAVANIIIQYVGPA